MMFADTATMTGADGRFAVVVPAQPVVLRVFGPTAEYRLCDYGYQRCPQCGKEHLRPGEHARITVNPAASQSGGAARGPARTESVRVTLSRGVTVTGPAVGPDGEAI